MKKFTTMITFLSLLAISSTVNASGVVNCNQLGESGGDESGTCIDCTQANGTPRDYITVDGIKYYKNADGTQGERVLNL